MSGRRTDPEPGAAERSCALRLFGRPSAAWRGGRIAFPEKGFVLVALIAAEPQGRVDRETARTILWGDLPDHRRSGNLRQLLLRIGRIAEETGPILHFDEDLLRLAPEANVDLARLLALKPADLLAGEGDDDLLADELLEGVEVANVALEDWLGDLRRRVAAVRTAVMQAALAATMGQDGRTDISAARRIRLAEQLVAHDPAVEVGHAALVLAHHASGSPARAREVWLAAKTAIRQELQKEPSPELIGFARKHGLEPLGSEMRERDPVRAPRLVILPPALVQPDPVMERLGHSILEDVTIGLSQFRSFRVIAAFTSWQLGRSEEPLNSKAEFDYAVTVGVRGGAETLSATCRLTRSADEEVLWAIELPLSPAELSKSLGDLVRRTVASLAAVVEHAEGRSPIEGSEPSGYRLYLEGKRTIGTTRLEQLRQARRWFRAAIQRCDTFSPAYAGMSRAMTMEWLVRGQGDTELLDQALTVARRAHNCDPHSGRAMRELGFTHLYRRAHDESLESFERARKLSPNDADLLADFADALVHDGQPERALGLMTEAIELNPLSPEYYYWIKASILYQLDRYAEAVKALEPSSASPATARLMAASAAMNGDLDRARKHAQRVRENYPSFKVAQVWDIVPDRIPADTEKLIEGLRLAGLD